MKTLGIVSLTLSILAASASVTMAQSYTATPGLSDVHNSIKGDMPRTHDKAAIVRELNGNGIKLRTDLDRSAYQAYFNPQGAARAQGTDLGQSSNQQGPYFTDHQSSRE